MKELYQNLPCYCFLFFLSLVGCFLLQSEVLFPLTYHSYVSVPLPLYFLESPYFVLYSVLFSTSLLAQQRGLPSDLSLT